MQELKTIRSTRPWQAYLGALTVALTCGAFSAFADVVEFTAAEGYTAGGLDDQPAGDADWQVINGTDPFTVDPTGDGSLSVNSASTGGPRAVYQNTGDLNPGMTFIMTVDFSFTESTTQATGDPLVLEPFTGPTGGGTNVALTFRRLNPSTGDAPDYQIIFYESSAPGATYKSAMFDEEGLGISGTEDLSSDVLRLSFALTKTTTTDTWSMTATLTNLDTSTEVASVSAETFVTASSVYNDTSLFAAFRSAIATAEVDALTIERFGFSTVPEPGSMSLVVLGLACLLGRGRASRRTQG